MVMKPQPAIATMDPEELNQEITRQLENGVQLVREKDSEWIKGGIGLTLSMSDITKIELVDGKMVVHTSAGQEEIDEMQSDPIFGMFRHLWDDSDPNTWNTSHWILQ